MMCVFYCFLLFFTHCTWRVCFSFHTKPTSVKYEVSTLCDCQVGHMSNMKWYLFELMANKESMLMSWLCKNNFACWHAVMDYYSLYCCLPTCKTFVLPAFKLHSYPSCWFRSIYIFKTFCMFGMLVNIFIACHATLEWLRTQVRCYWALFF